MSAGGLGLISGCAFDWQPDFDEAIEPVDLDTVAIAAVADALTFARVEIDGTPRAIAVTRYDQGRVFGIDLSRATARNVRDPIELFLELGYARLAELIGTVPAELDVAADELIVPVELRDRHPAAGTNFPEHAGETGVTDGPFLFPKLVAPTAARTPVAAGGALLDYEVEIAWVPLRPIVEGESPAHLGLLLCNDFTDREVLLHHIDVDDVASGVGFTTAKSIPGFLPVGDLFVIPRDHRAFAEDLQLQLFVNHRLRQRARVREMIWDIEELVAQTWARRDITWDHRGEQVSLFGDDRSIIQDRVLLMSGTPSGVVFNELDVEQKFSGFLDWLVFGWGDSIPSHAIQNYIDDARAAGIYLQPGDQVDIHVELMGTIRTQVTR